MKLAIKLHFYSKLTAVRGLAQRRQHGRRGHEAVGEQRSAGHASTVLTGGSASLLLPLPAADWPIDRALLLLVKRLRPSAEVLSLHRPAVSVGRRQAS